MLPTYLDEKRAEAIAETIDTLGADVVGLSEVWPDLLAERIAARLQGTYYAYRPPQSQELKIQTSGLLLLSRTPFLPNSCGFQPFKHLKFPDDQSNKGVAWAKSDVSVGGRSLRLAMFATHTQADYAGEDNCWCRQRNIEKVFLNISNIWDKGNPEEGVVLLGDLNVVAESPDGAATAEYRETRSHLEDLEDAFRRAHPDARDVPGFTYDGSHNTLVPRFAPDEETWRQRVDYHFMGGILARKGSLAARIPSREFSVRMQGVLENLSDHEALLTKWEPPS